MEQKNYHSSITANISQKEAFDNVARVDTWWAKSFKGRATDIGDTFNVRFGDTTVDFEITEAVPGKKVVWKVKDSYLPWLNNKTEWTGTSVEWEITPENSGTKIDMTHVGLFPGVECYEACNAGWNEHILGSLQQLMTTGTGQPQ